MRQRQISTSYKTNQQMRIGATVKVMLVAVVAVGFAACQSPTGMATNRDQNEPLGKQPADAEQNLSVMGQKQAVDGVKLQNRWNPDTGVNSVSFSPDGQILASGSSDSSIKLWKLDGTLIKMLTGHTNPVLIKTLRGHTNPVLSVSFSPDGQLLASGSLDETIKLWKQDGTLITTLRGHITGVNSVSFSPDGQTIASGGKDRTIRLWHRDGRLITTLRGHNSGVNSVRFSPDGQILASGSSDSSIKLWKRDGTLIKSLNKHIYIDEHGGRVSPNPVYSVRFSPDGQILASGSYSLEDDTVKLWKQDGTLLKTLNGPKAAFVESVSFSPDGQILAAGATDGTIKLWKRDGTLITTLKTDNVGSVRFSPDGQTLASSSSTRTSDDTGNIELWDLNQVTLRK